MAADDSGGPVRITNREIYDAVVAMRSDIRSLVESQQRQDETNKDFTSRLRAVEQKIWQIPGLATLIALASLALNFYRK